MKFKFKVLPVEIVFGIFNITIASYLVIGPWLSFTVIFIRLLDAFTASSPVLPLANNVLLIIATLFVVSIFTALALLPASVVITILFAMYAFVEFCCIWIPVFAGAISSTIGLIGLFPVVLNTLLVTIEFGEWAKLIPIL